MGKKGKQKKKEGQPQQQQQGQKQAQKKPKDQPHDPSGYAHAMDIPDLEENMEDLELEDSLEEEEDERVRGKRPTQEVKKREKTVPKDFKLTASEDQKVCYVILVIKNFSLLVF